MVIGLNSAILRNSYISLLIIIIIIIIIFVIAHLEHVVYIQNE